MLTRIASPEPTSSIRRRPHAHREGALHTVRRWMVGAALAVGCSTAIVPTAEAAEYLLAPGDRLEIAIVGAPDLKQQALIGTGGEVSMPLLGSVKAAGLTLGALRVSLQRQIAGQPIRLRTSSNPNEVSVLDPNDISVTIAEYRPVYVVGDVGRPGSQTFTPGITARQAIALAGGCDLARFGVQNPVTTAADLRGEYDRLSVAYLADNAKIQRIGAELAEKPGTRIASDDKVKLAPSVTADLVEREQRQLDGRLADLAKQRAFFAQQREVLENRVAALEGQSTKDDEGVKLDESESERITELNKRGVVPMPRVAEVRRISLFSATRALQTSAQALLGRKDLETLNRDEDAFEARRKDELNTLAAEATLRLQTTLAQLRATGDKLVYTGLFRSELSRGYGDPEVTLVRRTAGGTNKTAFGLDEELLPADVIQARCPFIVDPERLAQ